MNTRLLKARAAAFSLGPRPLRRMAGVVIMLSGCVVLAGMALDALAGSGALMRAAVMGGCIAAAATALGTLPVLFSQNFSKRSYDCFLGFGAGVMLAATSFSLIGPAIVAAKASGAGPVHASALVGVAILGGAAFMLMLERAVSASPDVLGEGALGRAPMKRAWLFVAAVALHNIPEGLAIGAAYAGADLDKANSLATGIAIQDVPEGLVVALALRAVGYGRWTAVGCGVASGLVEPLAAACGLALVGMSDGLLPLGLAGAAGAMLFVIVNDVVPESHRNNHGSYASCALVAGFIVMTFLDTAMG